MGIIEIDQLKQLWLDEEACAHMLGWDFSHIHGRYTEEADLPWDYPAIIQESLQPDHFLLDVDTGGGEFLLSLRHPYEKTSATEGYAPNVELCRRTLLPLGINFRAADAAVHLPFEEGTFDRIINRHGDVNVSELYRVLKPGGVFITEQIGAENDRDLVEWLLPGTPPAFPDQYLAQAEVVFREQGFQILAAQEAFRPIRFFDVGALVWFAHIIEWEFPGFSVEGCFPRLCSAQQVVEENGSIDGQIHRYLLVAEKP